MSTSDPQHSSGTIFVGGAHPTWDERRSFEEGKKAELLRDQFAGQAMASLIYPYWRAGSGDYGEPTFEEHIPFMAKLAYDIADAMLKARSA